MPLGDRFAEFLRFVDWRSQDVFVRGVVVVEQGKVECHRFVGLEGETVHAHAYPPGVPEAIARYLLRRDALTDVDRVLEEGAGSVAPVH